MNQIRFLLIIASLVVISAIPTNGLAYPSAVQIKPTRSRPVAQEMDSQTMLKAINDASQKVAEAVKLIDQTLPAYSGHRQQAKYKAQFAYENLTAAPNYKKPPQHRGPLSNTKRLSVKERLKSIPEAKEKSRRSFSSGELKNSDTWMNDAGLRLQEARASLVNVPDKFGGIVKEAIQLIDLAIKDVERSVGRIRKPK